MTLLAGWTPNATSRAVARIAKAAGVDVEAQHKSFLAHPRTEAPHDPDKAFQAWLERAVGYAMKGRPNPHGESESQQSSADHDLTEIQAFERESPAEFQRLKRYMESHPWWAENGRYWQDSRMAQAIRDRKLIFEFLDKKGREF